MFVNGVHDIMYNNFFSIFVSCMFAATKRTRRERSSCGKIRSVWKSSKVQQNQSKCLTKRAFKRWHMKAKAVTATTSQQRFE